MKKKLMTASLLLACVIAFTACANSGASSSQASSTAEDKMQSSETMIDDKTKDEAMMVDDKAKDEAMMTEDKAKDEAMVTAVENPAPNFTFTNFEGNAVTLADFEGEKVYIKFWASWCPICVGSLPEVDELSAMDKDFKVITVVAPGYSGEKKMEDFKTWYENKEYKNITVLFDDDGAFMKEFGIRAYPSSAYIDENGSLIKVEAGHPSNDDIIKAFA